MTLRIPAGFTIGAATAAFQIEGAVEADGRTPSSWDAFTAIPGKIMDGSDARVATGHYHRFAEDVALMRELGLDAYRFSLSWTRIQPHGRGAANPAGIAFYDRLIDALLEAGIAPMATLFHWDTPIELERRGGWRRRETALRFADYAAIAGAAFGDRIDAWVTVNEPATLTLEGYGLDLHAPGVAKTLSVIPVAKHLLLGHGLAVQALRSVPVAGRIGITNVHTAVLPATDSAADRAYAELFDFLHNRVFADPVLLGRTPDRPRGVGALGVALRALSRTGARDLETMAQPLDFYGLNYYFPTRIAAGPAPRGAGTPDGVSAAMDASPFHLADWPELPATGFGWPIAPQYLRVVLEQLASRYGDALPPVVITEGGASFADEPDADGVVDDQDRIRYLDAHLRVAIASVPGIDLRGYFVWTLLDNFEWAAGYTQRFGLVRVDFESLRRTPKASFRWLRDALRDRDT